MLIDAIVNWINHLPQASIASWDDIKTTFETSFKTPDNKCTLLLQLSQTKKEIHEPMREFVAKFNRLLKKISVASKPNDEN